MADDLSRTAPHQATNPPVAGNGAPGQAQPLPAAPSAKDTAPRFGGLRGGRKRKDGLVPGSPEALEADRKKDADRKARNRATKQADPAPLPSAVPGQVAPGAPPDAAPGGVLGSEADAPLPWQPEALQPIFDELVPLAESVDIKGIIEKAHKAKLPGELIHRIETDARWPELSKKGVLMSAPKVSAKLLNMTGISAEHQDTALLLTSVAAILASRNRVCSRLDKIIQQIQRPRPAAPESNVVPLPQNESSQS
jgi:hypothetical protein